MKKEQANIMDGTEVVVDRIEEEVAAIEFEDERIEHISLKKLPEGVKEGYVLRMEKGSWNIDMEAYERRKREIDELFSDLF